MFREAVNLEIWDRLIKAEPLDGLKLGTINGRIDVRGLELPDPSAVRQFKFKEYLMSEIVPGAIVRGAKWEDLDFSGSKLNGLRFFNCELNNCRFVQCQLQDLRIWSTTFRECSFEGAKLRRAALGGVQEGKRNIFSEVDFSDADLRETAYKAAAFEGCIFRNARLEKVDFQTSTFVECVFEGELRDVEFYRRGFQGEAFPANEMVNVDFSRAKLHAVAFRGLTLDRVNLPADADHIVIRDVAATLDRLLSALKQQGDTTAKKLAAFLNIDREWIPPDQAQKAINTQDLARVTGVEGVRRLRELLQQQ